MKSVISKRRGFPFSNATLLRAAQQLLGALQDGTLGSPLVVHLSSTFVVDFTAQVALVAKLGTDHSVAIGNVSTLTLSQNRALADYIHLAGRARRAARLAFTGQDTLLSSGFQVGASAPKSMSAILDRGRNLLTSCQTYAAELAPHNWSPASTEQLATALDTLTEVDRNQEATSDGKVGLTAGRMAEAKVLYRQCVALQNAARTVYGSADAPADAATVGARERFLLGAFPPRVFTRGTVVKPEPAAPVGVTPALPKAA